MLLLILLLFLLFLFLKFGCAIFKQAEKVGSKAREQEKARQDKYDEQKKNFIDYNLVQHNAPIQKEYTEEMDPDYEKSSDDEDFSRHPTALNNP